MLISFLLDPCQSNSSNICIYFGLKLVNDTIQKNKKKHQLSKHLFQLRFLEERPTWIKQKSVVELLQNHTETLKGVYNQTNRPVLHELFESNTSDNVCMTWVDSDNVSILHVFNEYILSMSPILRRTTREVD